MSTSFIAAVNFAIKQVTIYGSAFLLVTGVVGNLLNIIVLLSLRTFRQSSCAFYLTVMSFANICELLIVMLISRLLINIFGLELVAISAVYCRFHSYLIILFILCSLTFLCLATIDQYCATCSRPRWQQFCQIKVAWRIVVIVLFIVMLHGVPSIIFNNQSQSSTTGKVTCSITNIIYAQYRTYVTSLVFSGFLPVTIAVSFGLMAYRNIQELAYRTIPVVRRELEKQLTVMVLVQVIVNAFTLIPYTIVYAMGLDTSITSDPVSAVKLQLSSTVFFIIYYIYYAVSILDCMVITVFFFFQSPFYIYICVSERYRRQLIYVLFKIHLNRWRQPRMVVNQVAPAW